MSKEVSWEDYIRNQIRNELPLLFVQDAEDEIVSLFSKTLETAKTADRNRLREKIEGMMKAHPAHYNEALNELLKFLES